MKYALYKLNKTKITFKNNCLINIKLFQPTFNFLKIYAKNNFVQNIWNYSSIINYDIAHNKKVYKYFFQAFYERSNKKKYNL